MTNVNRRHFLSMLYPLLIPGWPKILTQGAWSMNQQNVLRKTGTASPYGPATDEHFWEDVQQAYDTSSTMINMNNAGIGPAPRVVQQAMKRCADICNEEPSYYMWQHLNKGTEQVRASLAELAGCSHEEIAIQRNATEALETVIFGLDLKAGDEVVLSKQDYPNMINAWRQRSARDGIKLVWVNLELPAEDEDYLANCYIKAFSRRTKVVHITHMINWNGQILPVRKIADAAHERGIAVLVDGAQSFAQLDFSIPQTGADYFGTSLHKWLGACLGTGMLYVKRSKINTLYPLFAAPDLCSDDIRKFEHRGTRALFIEQSVAKAVEFHNTIGVQRKEQRLFYLKNYWMQQVQQIPGVNLLTSMKTGFGCGIGLVSVTDRKPADLAAFLMERYKIQAVAIEWANIRGLRVTPNLYTTLPQLDLLAEGIAAFAKS